ncbi:MULTISPECIES: HPr family phosphocarrier protein [Brevibacillus]|jgi:phosphocarrier protein HPr|uniref:Phosphocarrier protein HPr n=1 Tax=Brevibacillus parabrevis TaxID=54914 RepID=A0A4Y3PTQ3_BREPA|nr:MULTISPECIES: HPr family phosphocarrier protein [Brevibacillus]TGV29428.1 HPr family phosphocarrier protein [Mesorhizobium sp. M00.F.Ca.ET.186.01.1.1]MBU8713420.1 HPr family phosphocarrier protein [Brevibacillus parabrevis]MDH6351141.1 phosphocarrier protein HPr [Brevibacillus sp. 1238]MDR4997615.1 HPr family phosphocarrier protein [Brevibacillus parabrevis]MED1722656.1 HPr family phosphocarrier protein [Brevibacillus parabrevis]
MVRFNVEITVSGGLHARPASVLVNLLNQYRSSVKMIYNDKQANGKSILSVMALGAKTGDEMTFEVEGIDEQETASALQSLFQRNFAV